MPIYFGSNKIKEIYNGSVPIKEVYNGSNKVFGSGAVIEYGKFSDDSLPEYTTAETFLPNFETSLEGFYIAQPYEDYYSSGAGAVYITNYVEKNSFRLEVRSWGSLQYNMSYEKTVEFNGVKFHKYNGVLLTSSSTTTTVYIPEGFILKTSWFLLKGEVVKSRGSDFSYVNSVGYTRKLRSRHKVNLITGEEK